MPRDELMAEACPECDDAEIRKREQVTPPFRCRDCGAEFWEPEVRPTRNDLSTYAIALKNDPEDLGLSPTGERST